MNDLERMQEHIWNDFARTARSHADDVVKQLSGSCESPIEIMLGSAIYLGACVAYGPFSPTKLLRIEPQGIDIGPCHGQWVMVPQFKWDRYRIDFALRTKLPYPIFIECDGHDFHERTKQDAQRDREKDRAIQTAGIPILRFTGSEIYKSPQACGFQVYTFARDRILEFNKTEPPRFTPGGNPLTRAQKNTEARRRDHMARRPRAGSLKV